MRGLLYACDFFKRFKIVIIFDICIFLIQSSFTRASIIVLYVLYIAFSYLFRSLASTDYIILISILHAHSFSSLAIKLHFIWTHSLALSLYFHEIIVCILSLKKMNWSFFMAIVVLPTQPQINSSEMDCALHFSNFFYDQSEMSYMQGKWWKSQCKSW